MLLREVLHCLNSLKEPLAIEVADVDLFGVAWQTPPSVCLRQLNGGDCAILGNQVVSAVDLEFAWRLAQIPVEIGHLIIANRPEREDIPSQFLASLVLCDESKLVMLG